MPLMGLATMNAFVHVVMYSYYLAAAMKLEPPLWCVRVRVRVSMYSYYLAAAMKLEPPLW